MMKKCNQEEHQICIGNCVANTKYNLEENDRIEHEIKRYHKQI